MTHQGGRGLFGNMRPGNGLARMFQSAAPVIINRPSPVVMYSNGYPMAGPQYMGYPPAMGYQNNVGVFIFVVILIIIIVVVIICLSSSGGTVTYGVVPTGLPPSTVVPQTSAITPQTSAITPQTSAAFYNRY